MKIKTPAELKASAQRLIAEISELPQVRFGTASTILRLERGSNGRAALQTSREQHLLY